MDVDFLLFILGPDCSSDPQSDLVVIERFCVLAKLVHTEVHRLGTFVSQRAPDTFAVCVAKQCYYERLKADHQKCEGYAAYNTEEYFHDYSVLKSSSIVWMVFSSCAAFS